MPAAALGILQLFRPANPAAKASLKLLAMVAGGLFVAMLILKIDFGWNMLKPSQWGGLLVTLVVAITGIVASLPLGILLALGRRSKMPIVKYFCVTFIEVWARRSAHHRAVHGQRHAPVVSCRRAQISTS